MGKGTVEEQTEQTAQTIEDAIDAAIAAEEAADHQASIACSLVAISMTLEKMLEVWVKYR
jgi:predicted transcriptional regulator